jgi:ApbE superfamily uncharacterized protein (UPF0280 family)
MMLGEVLRRLSETSDDELALSFAGDAVQLARIRTAAEKRGQSLATYIRDAVSLFLDRASEEELATAMGHMRDDPMPGDRLVKLAIERQLRQDAA